MVQPNKLLPAIALAVATLSGATARGTVVFDFEDESLTGFNAGALTNLTMTSGALTTPNS